MNIQQADLFHGMDGDFVKEVMDITTKVTFETGDLLFREGDPADNFYILLKGRVSLRTGGIGQVAHMVSHSGEAFGWSSLTGRSTYSASAMCETHTKLLNASGEQVARIIENHPEQGLVSTSTWHKHSEVASFRLTRRFRHPRRSAPRPPSARATSWKPRKPRSCEAFASLRAGPSDPKPCRPRWVPT